MVAPVTLLLRQIGDVAFADVLRWPRCGDCRGKPAPVYVCATPHRTFNGGPAPDWAIELGPVSI